MILERRSVNVEDEREPLCIIARSQLITRRFLDVLFAMINVMRVFEK